MIRRKIELDYPLVSYDEIVREPLSDLIKELSSVEERILNTPTEKDLGIRAGLIFAIEKIAGERFRYV